MRIAPILLSALLLGVTELPAQASRVRIAVTGHNAPVIVDSLASRFTVTGTRRAVLDATAKALMQFGATLDVRDTVRGVFGMTNVARMRVLGALPLSRIVNCGSGMLGPNADNWRVYLTTYAFVDAIDSTTTQLRVAVIGGARDVAGTSTGTVPCSSTGVLEERVHERVRRLLAEPPG